MSNVHADGPMASAPGANSSGVLVVLKQKMQNMRDDLDKYRDMYEEKCQEAESERSRRNEVSETAMSVVVHKTYNTEKVTDLCSTDFKLDLYSLAIMLYVVQTTRQLTCRCNAMKFSSSTSVRPL